MSWVVSQPNVSEVNEGDLPSILRIALSFIFSSPYVVKGSVKAYKTDKPNREYVFSFKFLWDQPAKTVNDLIKQPEPIALWYSSQINTSSSPQVRSDRIDFPRDLPHLNPVLDTDPPWLCLAREGLSSIYQRGGLPAIFQRLSMWLRDAAAGYLDHDGWEPVPRSGSFSATLDIAWFQKAAFNSTFRKSGHVLGYALLFLDTDKDGNKVLHTQLVSRKKEIEKIWIQEPDETFIENRRAVNGFWFMAWGERAKTQTKRYNKSISTISDLYEFAAVAGCEKNVRSFIDVICNPDSPSQSKGYVILIGEWRPKQLIQTIPGLANGEARKLEMTGFLVFTKVDGTKREVSSIDQLELLAEANADNLNKLAGFNVTPNRVVLIGAGALGSKLAVHLIREGVAKLTIADNDRVAPHNLSRHALTGSSLYFNKATELRSYLLEINKALDINALDEDVGRVQAGSFSDKVAGHEQGVLIDCTADLTVMRRLCLPDNVMRTAKLELADNGNIGMLLYEGHRRNPRIDDLKALIPYMSIDIPELSIWLNRADDPKVDTGMGCASASMPMSDSLVSAHSANFMASISKIIRDHAFPSGLGMALTNDQGHINNWIWIDEPSVLIHEVKSGEIAWQVRIRKSVVDNVNNCRDQAKPNEAGGYLYGSFDLTLKIIYVVFACEPVPIMATPVSIKLPPAGKSEEEMKILHACAGRLQLLGTWHSHPNSDSGASSTDRSQFISDTSAYAANPSPHLLMIIGENGISTTLGSPALWQ